MFFETTKREVIFLEVKTDKRNGSEHHVVILRLSTVPYSVHVMPLLHQLDFKNSRLNFNVRTQHVSANSLKRNRHFAIDCVPVPRAAASEAPGYYKKVSLWHAHAIRALPHPSSRKQ
eukprot:SAG11_NODE_5102_length_1664_cov_2.469649_2_plen_117_part_00